MASTRSTLDRISDHVDESLGMRPTMQRPQLSPVPSPRDLGRRPAPGFGRVDVEQVIADPDQPRSDFDSESLSRLADNMRAKGQLHPIHVRWSDELGKWVIVSGERRWRAACSAGMKTIDCRFHEQPLSKPQILELQMIENLLREDLKPMEEARAFRDLMQFNGWNGKQLAESLGIPASKVSRSLPLLDLPTDIQRQVDAGEVSARTAYELTKAKDDATRRRLAQQAAAGNLTNADAAKTLGQKPRKQQAVAAGVKQTFFADNDWVISVTRRQAGSYLEMEQAVLQVLDEIRLRVENNIRL